MRQILTEYILPKQQPLKSEFEVDPSGEKKLWLKGLCMVGEQVNANGREYSREEISHAVDELMKSINENNGIIGQLDHPNDLMIEAKNASHVIRKVYMEGNNAHGEMIVIPEGNGKIVQGLVSAGVRLGISSRGSGSVDSRGKVSEFSIVTLDLVSTPSGPGCYLNPMYESLINSRTGQELKNLSELQDDRAAQKYFQKALHNYLMEIRDQVLWKRK